ncbi:MAG: pyridoxal-phosphate dependent enzyme, partial [Proteobacteria bacterium]
MDSFNEHIFTNQRGISLFLKREDLVHATIPGNKFRKLKYNLIQAKSLNKSTLLTFGGAYSNHIAAVAQAGKEFSFDTIGIIRGEEIRDVALQNPTLVKAMANGMRLEFINRQTYRSKSDPAFIKSLESRFGDFYLLPEGGTNALAIQGCEEILSGDDFGFDYICCAVGTGGTLAGISNSADPSQQVLGFPALKGEFLNDEIRNLTASQNWTLITGY